MRLYLSSYRVPVPEELFRLVGKPSHEIKMAIVPNAKDKYIDRIWWLKTNQAIDYFKDLGVEKIDVVDLRTYDNNSADKLEQTLAPYDLVWCNGGSTFMLLYEIRRSGFDVALRRLLEKDALVYGGASAGELVAGPSISGIELADNPEFAEKIVTNGMNLVSEYIFPHADDPTFAEALADFRSKHGDIIELKNSQAFVVDGGRREIVGVK